MKYKFGLIFAVILVVSPLVALASVKINEIAWMGDIVSPDHEWIELYNDTDLPQDLASWKLVATDTVDNAKEKFSLSLSGTIDTKGYFLIEKKRSTVDTAPYLASDLTAVTFSLVNSGETLSLKKADGEVADEVKSPFVTKWEAGNNTTKETAQRDSADQSKWITATATPRMVNYSAPVETENSGNDDTSATTTATTTTATTTAAATTNSTPAYSYSAHSGSSDLSNQASKTKAYLSAGRDRIVCLFNFRPS